MDETNTDGGKPAGRSDVGYKRPPREHQFKKGQKRPPRKPKEAASAAVPLSEILRKVLHERRRVERDGKVSWATGAELVIRRAYLEAERGKAILRRELARLLLSLEEGTAAEQGLLVITDPTSEAATELRLANVDQGEA